MKELKIRKSKKKSGWYLVMCLMLVTLFIFFLVADPPHHYHYRRSYWFGIILFGLLSLLFFYDFINRRPIYVINEKGIRLRNGIIITWKNISHFKLEITYSKNITYKQAVLFNMEGNDIGIIDVSFADVSLDRLERTLKKKIKLMAKE